MAGVVVNDTAPPPALEFGLAGEGPLQQALRMLGYQVFSQLAQAVRALRYGRVNDSADPMAPLRERRGSCSSKHRLLAAVAAECGQRDIALTLGLYFMSEDNTPGVGPVLAAAGLAHIPEMHCYLTCRGRRYDYTGLAAGRVPVFDALLEERSVAPDELAAVKVPSHRAAMARWAASLGMDAGRAWAIRERCVDRLAASAARQAGKVA